ncbi:MULTISPECIES: NAD-dependent epimerase/dehydratase family protein [Brevibacillus]|jgi:nucleoside-diphosphate-sugar epimerase|uniref:NAD-dependent epimerase/dehydratase family protein n=1 Tax=Brevibacillus TaxID=55080 RepID=UPI001FA9A79C|nr:NAD-dependent epimerase/dehydratase family protein [Brevibacillus borstelensis]
MKKVLVLGGTRFFGKRLVKGLVDSGYDVTIATRGRQADPFGNEIARMQVDRNDLDSLKRIGSSEWELVFDSLCYTGANASHIVQVLEGKVKRLVVTSSRAVYEHSPLIRREADFDPYSYPITAGTREEVSYEEGKRQAEAALFQKAGFPVIAVRFPIVLGVEDYTKRLHFYVDQIRAQKEIYVGNPHARQSYIDADEAARFLQWAGESAQACGPYNACSDDAWTLPQLLGAVEDAIGKPARILTGGTAEQLSPFAIPDSYVLDTGKARREGYAFRSLSDWLVPLIQRLAAE